MRIMFVITSLEIGGGQIFLCNLANHLSGLGHEIAVFCYDSDIENNLRHRLSPAIDYAETPGTTNPERLPLATRHFQAHLARFKPEIINSHLYWADRMVSFNRPSLPFVISEHGDYKLADLELKPEVLSGADMIISASQFARRYLLALGDFEVRVAHCGHRPLAGTARLSRAELGLNQDDFVFCMLARGYFGKGWREAIYAMELLRGAPGISLLAIGEGEAVAWARAYCLERGLDNVRFAGQLAEPQGHLAVCDAMLLPSHAESLPLSLIEGLHLGKPFVASDVGGISELAGPCGQEAGLLCPAGPFGSCAPEDLAALMLRLREEVQALSRNALKRSELFRLEASAGLYLEIFLELIEKQRARQGLAAACAP